MFKKFKVSDCFLDVTCYCLEINANFDQFQKECLKLCYDDVLIIKNSGLRSNRMLSVTFVACCKNFIDFQIDLFIKASLFPLKKIDCNYPWARGIADFESSFLEIYYNDSDNDESDNDDDNDQTNVFTSSICFTKMRSNLKFTRFCAICKNVFMTFFCIEVTCCYELFFSL